MRILFALVCVFALNACSNSTSSAPVPSQKPTIVTDDMTPLSVSEPNVYEMTETNKRKASVHIYPEDGMWVVQKNIIAADGMPDPGPIQRFTTKRKAYKFAKETYGITEAMKNPKALDGDGEEFLIEALNNGTGLWEAPETNKWTWEKEKEFAKWTRKNLKPKFFQDLKIENDCADAYYQARMIFARENRLPVAFRLAGGNVWFTQNTMRPEWKKLKTDSDWRKDQRFLKALDYIANTTYTHTLGRDTYPVALTKEGLLEGTALLSISGSSGHTLIVNEINLNNVDQEHKARLPMYTLNSTVPKSLQPLYESFFFDSTQPEKSKVGFTGFVRFRWPKGNGSALVEAKDMPHYSEEQYSPTLLSAEEGGEKENFSIFVFKRLNPNFDPSLRISEGLDELKELLFARIDVVVQGYEACKKGCKEGSPTYESWSTPSRDKRLAQLSADLYQYYNTLSGVGTVEKIWMDAQDKTIVTVDGQEYNYKFVRWALESKLLNSDPNQTVDRRWGMSPEAYSQALYEEVVPLIKARKAKIDSNACTKSTCALFSLAYFKNSTFTEDSALSSAVKTRREYCDMATPAMCQAFQSRLATLPSVVPQHPTFLETWNNSASFNSDPRSSENSRWGINTAFNGALELPGGWSVSKTSTAGYMILSDNNYPSTSTAIVDINKKKILRTFKSASNDYMEFALNSTSSLVLIYSSEKKGHGVQIYDAAQDLVVQEIKSPEVNQTSTAARWIGEDRILLTNEGGTVLMQKKDNPGFEVVREFPGYSFISGRNTSLYRDTLTIDGKLSIIDIEDPEFTPITVDVLKEAKVPKISYGGRSMPTARTFVITWNFYGDKEDKTGRILVNLNKKAIVPIPAVFGNYVDVENNMYIRTEKNNTAIYFVDDELNVKKHLTFAGSCGNCYDSSKYIQIASNIYSIDRENMDLEKVATIEGAGTLSSFFDNQAIINQDMNTPEGDSVSALVSLETGKTRIMAPYLTIGADLNEKVIYPHLHSSWSTYKDTNGSYFSYFFSAVLDLDKPEQGALSTNSFAGEEGGDGHHSEVGQLADLATPVPPLTDKDYGKYAKVPAPKVTILKPQVSTEQKRPVSIINLNEAKTLVIFRN